MGAGARTLPTLSLMPSRQHSAAWLLAGMAAAVLGLLPWLTTGARLPLQNLWATHTLPAQMPIALLPLNQYYLLAIVALLLAPVLPLGLLLRHRSNGATIAAAAGLSTIQLAAAVQATVAVASGLDESRLGTVYLMVLVALQAVSLLLAQACLWAIRTPSPVVAALGIGLVALLVPSWITAWWLEAPLGAPTALRWIVRLGPAILVGLALGWCGISSAARLLVWLTDLVLLWVVPALTIALTTVASSRAILRTVTEIPEAVQDYLRSALGPAGGGPERLLLAVAIALAIMAVRRLVRPRTAIQSATQ